MTRLIKHSTDKPFIHITPSGDKVKICMCCISKTYPFCDSSHGKTKDENNELCCYDKEGNRLTYRVCRSNKNSCTYLDDDEITDV